MFTSFLFDKIMLIWYKIPHYQCGFCAVSEKGYFLVYGAVFRDFTKSYFISYEHNFIEQKRTYVIFLDIGEILEKGVHKSSVCDMGVYTCRFPNFHPFKQFPFQIPYNLDNCFQFSITFNNSFLPFQFPYPFHMLPISRNLYLFPISPKPCQLSLLSVHSFVFTDIFQGFQSGPQGWIQDLGLGVAWVGEGSRDRFKVLSGSRAEP